MKTVVVIARDVRVTRPVEAGGEDGSDPIWLPVVKRASICLVLAASVLLSCSVEPPPREGPGERGPGGIVAGMTREQVVQAMLQEVQALQMAGRVRNPYATLFVPGRDGETLEVMYYYVTMKKGDNVVTSDEMVPVILKGGRVAGWGWDLLEELSGGRPAPEEPG